MNRIITYHIVGWLLYTGMSFWDIYMKTGTLKNYLAILLTISEFAMVFYGVAYFILPKFYNKKKHLHLGVVIVFFFLIFFGVDYLIEGVFELWLYGYESLRITPQLVLTLFWYYVQFAAFGSAHYFAKQAVQKERLLRISEKEKFEHELTIKAQQETQLRLEAQTAKLRQANAELENEFLRAQLNPHFLFNILGLFQTKTRKTNPDVSEGIVILSEIMRYILKKPDDDGMITLDEEIQQIKNMIALYNLRFQKNMHLEFNIKGNNGNERVAPFVFFTLAENALKHGDLTDNHHPVSIHIEIKNQQLHFSSHNKICARPPDHGFRIGLANVKKRLELTYNGTSRYEVTENNDFYTCNLSIPV